MVFWFGYKWLPAGVCGAETIRGGGGIMVKFKMV